MAINFRVSRRSREFDRAIRKIDRLPIEINRELKRQALEKAGQVIVQYAKRNNFAFIDRTDTLRRSIRLGRPKSTRHGVQIPIIAGRDVPRGRTSARGISGAHYAGFVELGTDKFLPRHFLRRSLFSAGVRALVVLQRELRDALARYSRQG